MVNVAALGLPHRLRYFSDYAHRLCTCMRICKQEHASTHTRTRAHTRMLTHQNSTHTALARTPRSQITPAHDPNDFKTGKRHNLESINVFDDDGCINEQGGEFAGQPRFKVHLTCFALQAVLMRIAGLLIPSFSNRGTGQQPLNACSSPLSWKRSVRGVSPEILPWFYKYTSQGWVVHIVCVRVLACLMRSLM